MSLAGEQAAWDYVYRAMMGAGVRDPQSLMVPRPGSISTDELAVVDSVNGQRLLGYLSNVPKYAAGHDVFYACGIDRTSATPFNAREYDTLTSMLKVEFRVVWPAASGYTRTAALATCSPLSTLVRLDSFRLPHDSYSQAHERRWRAEYGR